VLVVDDESCVRSVAKSILTELGFDVAEAENGAVAEEMVREDPNGFLAVLLDVAMPVMGGAEALERLRAIRPDLTIIMSSGYSESATVGNLTAGKPSGFLSKPYSAAQFAEVFLGTLGAITTARGGS
jgi:CheY-like chemotaxis protein